MACGHSGLLLDDHRHIGQISEAQIPQLASSQFVHIETLGLPERKRYGFPIVQEGGPKSLFTCVALDSELVCRIVVFQQKCLCHKVFDLLKRCVKFMPSLRWYFLACQLLYRFHYFRQSR